MRNGTKGEEGDAPRRQGERHDMQTEEGRRDAEMAEKCARKQDMNAPQQTGCK